MRTGRTSRMNLQTLSLAAAAATLLSLSSSALAQTQAGRYLGFEDFERGLRFGAEWTLTSDDLFKSFPSGPDNVVTTPYSRRLVTQFQQALQQKYLSQAEKPTFSNMNEHSKWKRDAFSIEYSNQFKMTVFTDPGVLEVNSSPSSVTTLEENRERIQSDIFDQGKKLGQEPGLFAGSGHMHIETTGIHPDTLRNFLADYYNHTGLAAGALNEDVYNALGPGEMSEKNKQVLREAFTNFDALHPDHRDLVTLISQIQLAHDIPLHEDLQEYRDSGRSQRARKYFAISYRSYDLIKTVEIRALRPQASADAYLKLAKLWVARMKVAEAKRQLGILVEINELKSVRGKPQAILADFDHYLEEAGLKLEDYQEFVLPWWQGPGGEVEKYLVKKSLRAPKVCTDLFKTVKSRTARPGAAPSGSGRNSKAAQPSKAPSVTQPKPRPSFLNWLFGS